MRAELDIFENRSHRLAMLKIDLVDPDCRVKCVGHRAVSFAYCFLKTHPVRCCMLSWAEAATASVTARSMMAGEMPLMSNS